MVLNANSGFSVLLSIYWKEQPEFLERAFKSIWQEQTLKPSQIVLVKDGPLTLELDAEVEKLKDELGPVLEVVTLEKNVGLGKALRIGLKHCKCEIVARMDTDDIANKDRFKKQFEQFIQEPNLGLLGSNVAEFDTDENTIVSRKLVPEMYDSIAEFSKSRNPFNHPTVMYKKSAVEDAGGYIDCPGMEDYYLWVRMLANGVKAKNISEELVLMRAGLGMLSRRNGLNYAKQEIKFQLILFKMKYIGMFRMIKNICLRLPPRLLPSIVLGKVYKLLRS